MAKRTYLKLIFSSLIFMAAISARAETAVEKHGWLKTQDGLLLDKNNKIVQLRGMSFFWSNPDWEGQYTKYYNAATVDALVDNWKCTVLRVAYDRDKNRDNGWDGCQKVIDEAIKKGIYVIIDWHSHMAHKQETDAVKFFKDQAKKYKSTPNVIFEPFNEPTNANGDEKTTSGTFEDAKTTWSSIKSYLNNVTKAIRDEGADNIVILGTPFYCQYPQVAAADPISITKNVMYTFHFYAASHGPEAHYVKGQSFGGMEASYLAAARGKVPIFVSEWGTSHSNGGQEGKNEVDGTNTKWWFDNYIDKDYHYSWCNWSVSDFQSSSAFGSSGTSSTSKSGEIVKKLLTSPTTDTYDLPSEIAKEGPGKNTVYTTPGYHPIWKYNQYNGAYFTGEAVKYAQRDKIDVRNAKDSCLRVSPGINNEWISFNIKASSQTKYIFLRCLASGGSGLIDIYLDDTKIGNVSVSKKAGWNTIRTDAKVTTGDHKLKFKFPSAADSGYSVEWFDVTDSSVPNNIAGLHSKSINNNILISNHNGSIVFVLPELHSYTSYSLVGVDGRIVQHRNLEKTANAIPVNNLPNGMWFLKINAKNGNHFYKAFLQN